jgi:hypothetical protein
MLINKAQKASDKSYNCLEINHFQGRVQAEFKIERQCENDLYFSSALGGLYLFLAKAILLKDAHCTKVQVNLQFKSNTAY